MFKSLSRRRKKQSHRTGQISRPSARDLHFEQLEARQLLTAVSSVEVLQKFNITGNVGEKPESKIWKHGGKWWGVFSDTLGSHLYRLDGTKWNQTLKLSDDLSIKVDVKSQGNVAHVFFENDLNSKLVSLEYVPGTTPNYQPWSTRPEPSPVALAGTVEAATIDIDSTGRMWVAYDEQASRIQVKYSDAPYTTWSDPIVVASGIFFDDVSSIVALPGKIAVMWSDQVSDRFGFRTHIDGTDPTSWTANEVPGGRNALSVGRGMSDDHINLAVASDGTLYAAVKTGYDLDPHPWIGLLVRRPNGVWDDFYGFNGLHGTRPAVQLNEAAQTLIYSYDDDFDWVYRECSTVTLVCGDPKVMLTTGKNATSTKQVVSKDLVVLTSGKSTAGGVEGALLKFNIPNTAPSVDAGPNQTIFATQTATLNGFADDDGLPDPPATLTTTWTKVVGPGVVTFGNASRPQTTASFSKEGAYTLRLTASDGTLTSFDDISIVVGQTPANQPPVVTVGSDITIGIAQTPVLDGTIVDDGLPFNPGTVVAQWSKISGPGTVTFGTPTAHDTTVSFNAVGTYTLRLTGFDGEFTASDDIVVTVNLLPPNQAPVVNAGPDQTILLGSNATLNGTFTDDGQPVPNNSVTTQWSKVSGPGTVSFLNATAANTAANFSQAGTYVLALSANDTELIGQDTITITVLDTPPSQTLSFQDGVAPTAAYTGTRDTKMRSDQPTTIHGSNSKLEVDGSPDFSSIIKWDISAIPSDSVVTGASFTVNVVNTTPHSFRIYEVLKSWVESQATFNQAATGLAWQIPGAAGTTDRGSTVVGAITAPALGQVTVTLNAAGVAMVQKWITNPSTNNGLIIQDYDNALTDDMDFNSREITTPASRPRLNVSYTTIPVNDPPFISNLNGDVLEYLEHSGPKLIDQLTPVVVSDADSSDFAFGSLKVAITSGGVAANDLLSIQNLGAISVVGNDVRFQGNVIGTVSGGSNGVELSISLNQAATPAALTALINAVAFTNISDNPSTAPRIVTYTLNDGDGTNNGGNDTARVTATINIKTINDPPAIIDLHDDQPIYIEKAAAQRIDLDTPAVVGDLDSPDFNGGWLRVSLGTTVVPAQDILQILPTGPITVDGNNVLHSGTVLGTLSGGSNGTDLVINFGQSASKPAVNALIGAIAYRNTSSAPQNPTRVVTFTVNDGDGVAFGGADTGSESVTITITPINDPPTLAHLGQDVLTYIEGSNAQVIDQGTRALLGDVDSLDLDTGTVTVTLTTDAPAGEDLLTIKHTGSGTGQVGFNGTAVSYQGQVIGTVTGGLLGSPLVIQLNGAATPVAVSAVLSAVAYSNTSNTPTTTPRTVTFRVTDGDGTADGGNDTVSATATIQVVANNDPPAIGNLNGDVLAYLENSGSKFLDQGTLSSVVDVDSPNFGDGSLTVAITSGGASDQDVLSVGVTANISVLGADILYQGTLIGTMSGGANGANLVIALNNAASTAAVSALLQALIYANTSVAPTAEPRSVTVTLIDGDGTENGGVDAGSATMTIQIEAINSPPVMNHLQGDTTSYVEDTGAQRIDRDVVVSVVDNDSPNFAGGWLTVSIAAGAAQSEDLLSILSGGDITVAGTEVRYQGNLLGTVSGGANGSSLVVSLGGNANPVSVSALLHAIAYTNLSHTPSTEPRQITLTLNDGDGTSNGGQDSSIATVTVTVTPSNDAPVLNHFGEQPLQYTENAGPQLINQAAGALVSDVDSENFDGGTLTVEITAGGAPAQDVLSIRNLGDISFADGTVSHQGTAIGTTTGGSNGLPLVISLNSAATPQFVSALLHALSYTNTSEAPTTTSRVVRVSLKDGDGVAHGGTDTGTANATIHVQAVNDLPAFSGLNGGSSFTEGGASVVIDPDVTLRDFELEAAGNYNGLTLTVQRQGGANEDDVFSIQVAGTPGFTVGAGVLQAGTTTFATFVNNPGVLTIQFENGATAALVNDVLQRLVYANAGTTLPSSVTLTYTITDGNSGNAQGTGANPGTGVGTAVVAINKLPELVNLNGGATYVEDGSAIQVDSDALLADAELDAADNYAGATVTVVRSGGAASDDLLTVGAGAVTLAGIEVKISDVVVATLLQGPGSTLVLEFTANATAAAADEVLQAITYANQSQNPPANVTLEYTFHDGAASVTGSAVVLITSVNDPPVTRHLDGDTLHYLENAGPVSIDQGLTAEVPLIDSANFDGGSLTVAFESGVVPTEDSLSIRTTGSISLSGNEVLHFGIVIGTFSGGDPVQPLVVLLNAAATPSAVSALLQAIGYANSSDAPVTTPRVISFTLVDGDGVEHGGNDTSMALATVHVTSVNDAPVISDLAGDTTTFVEDSPAQILNQDLAAAISDIDSSDFAGGTVTASVVAGGSAGQDVLSVATTGDITVDGSTVSFQGTPIGTLAGGRDGESLVITLNESATAVSTAALLNALAYANESQAPTTSSRVISVSLNDGDGASNGGQNIGTAQVTVHITAINDAPVFVNLNGGNVLNQGGAPVLVDANATIRDFELAAANNYAGATLTIARQGSVSNNDQFGFSLAGTPGFTLGAGVLKANNVPFANFTNIPGLLAIQFTAGATSTLVDEVLQRITYFNTATDLPPSVNLLLMISDGNADDAQGLGDNPGNGSGTALVTINRLPVLTNLNGGAAYMEDGDAVLVDTDAILTDLEHDTADNYSGTTITVARQGGAHANDVIGIGSATVTRDGSNVLVGGVVVATILSGPASTLQFSFTENATSAIANEVLQAVNYANLNQNPPAQVTLTYTAHDGFAAVTGSATVSIQAINDAPSVSELSTLDYLENSGAQIIDQGTPATVSDIDSVNFDGGSLTVSFFSGGVSAEDVLSIRNGTNIQFDGVNVSYLGTLIGAAAGGVNGADLEITFNSMANPTSVSALLQSVTYRNTSDVPTIVQRLVTFTLVDGDGTAFNGTDTSVTTATINVTAVNDPPVFSQLTGDTLSYTENSGPQVIDTNLGALVSDVDSVDFDGGSLTVTIASGGSSAQDVLSIVPVGDITIDGAKVLYLGNEIGTMAGGGSGTSLSVSLNSAATPLALSAVVRAVAYTNLSDAPSTTPRVVTFALNDGDGTANNGANVGTATATVQVVAVNDPPVFVGLNSGSIFTEGGSSVVIDGDATIVDPELDAVNNYTGAALTVTRYQGQNLDDVFGFNTVGASFTVVGNELRSNGLAFATVTHTLGLFLVNFTSAGTIATAALVDDVLQRITYRNNGTTLPTSVALFITVSDGNLGGQGIGAAPGTDTAIPVITINKLPVLSNLSNEAHYIENGAPVRVDQDVVVSDLELDSSNSYAGASLTVTRNGGAVATDVISLASDVVSVSGQNVLIGGTTVATLSQGPGSTLVVTFNSNATATVADQVLQAVTYSSTNNNPSTSLVLRYSFSDGAVATHGTTTVTVTPVNDAPVITNLSGDELGYIVLTAIGNAPPQVIDQPGAVVVTDIDSTNFNGGSVTVTVGGAADPAEDELSIKNSGTGPGQISVNGSTVRYQGVTIGTATGGAGGIPLVITLNAFANAAAVSALLGAITYENTEAEPDLAPRTVTFALNDGDGTLLNGTDTAYAVATITLRPINDPPEVSHLEGDILRYTENAAPQRIDQGTGPIIVDADSPNFGGGFFTAAITTGAVGSEDVLSINAHDDITVNGADVLHLGIVVGTVAGGTAGVPLTVSFNTSATLAIVGEVLAAVHYSNTSDAPHTSPRHVLFTLNDGDGTQFGGSDTTTVEATIYVEAVNDAPTLANVNGSGTFSSGAAPIVLDADATVSDIELAAAGDYAGSSIIIHRHRGTNPDDFYGFTSSPNFTVAGSVLQANGAAFASFQIVEGTLTITFTSSQTPATPALVNDVLQHVYYQNVSSVLPLYVQMAVTFSDGNTGDAQGTGLSPASASATALVMVNYAPVFIQLNGGSSHVEDQAAVPVDSNAVVADPELDSMNDYSGATFRATIQGGVSGQESLGLGSAFVTVTGGNVKVNGITVATLTEGPGLSLAVSFNGNATSAAADRVLQALTYSNSSQNPQGIATVGYEFSDGSGVTFGSATVTLVGVNDAPVISQTSVLTYTENSGPVRIDHAATAIVTDVDSPNFGGGSFTVSIVSGGAQDQDRLGVHHSGSATGQIGLDGSSVQFGGTTIGTISGGSGGDPLVVLLNESATPAAVIALFQSITYENISDAPTSAQRVLAFTLNDGDGTANGGTNLGTASGVIHIVPTNDAPQIADLEGDTLGYTENIGPQQLDQGVAATVIDFDSADFNGGSLVASFLTGGDAAQDVLSIQSLGDITVVGNEVRFQGTTIGTWSGGNNAADLVISFNSSASLAAVTALLRTISYEDVSDTSSTGPRTITLTLNDGDGADVGTATTTVEFTAVNDAPAIQHLHGDIRTYTENGAAVLIDVGTAVTVQDIDSPNFDGGSLSIVVNGAGPQTGDLLGIQTNGTIQQDGNAVQYQGTVIGTITPASNNANLTIALNGQASSAKIAALLRAITYRNTSDAPPASRQITVTLVDGDGTADGGVDTATVQTTVTILSVNDPPVISGLAGDTLAFVENGLPQTIDQGAIAGLTDLDSFDFDGGTLRVAITSGKAANEDVLSVQTGGTISLIGGNIQYLGTVIGALSGGTNGADLVVDLNAAANQSAVAALIGAVTYVNVSDAPQANNRIITFSLNDGDGTANGGIAVGTAVTTVQVTAVNDAPVINFLNGDTLSYVEGSGAVAIDRTPAAVVVDVDSVDLFGGSLTVSFQSGVVATEDVLSILTTTDISLSGVNVRYQGNSVGTFNGGSAGSPLVVNFFASANATSVTALLRAIAYTNTSIAPKPHARTVGWSLNDGDGTANGGKNLGTATTTINVLAVNAPPVISGLADETLAYLEDSGPQVINQGNAPTVLDPDSSDFASGNVTVSFAAGGVAASDRLAIRHTGIGAGQIGLNGTTVTYGGVAIGTAAGGANGTNLVISLNSSANAASVAALLGAITFEHLSDDPGSEPRKIAFRLTDGDGVANGGSDTASVTATVQITGINDAPLMGNLNGDLFSYTENSGPVIIDHLLPATLLPGDSPDFDGGSLTVAITAGGVATEDILSVIAEGNLTVNGNQIQVSGTQIGTATGGVGGTALVISFNANATPAAVESVLRAVAYTNTSSIPNTTSRQVTFTLKDGDGTANGGSDTSSVVATVSMLPVNAPPVLSGLDDLVLYEEGAGVQQIDQGTAASVLDDDSDDFAGGYLAVSIDRGGSPAQDVLSVRTAGDISLVDGTVRFQGTVFGTVSGGVNGAALVIDFNAAATPTVVSALLNAITFVNPSENPTQSDRDIVFLLNDGDGVANGGDDTGTATTTIRVTALNDVPVLNGLEGNTFTQGGLSIVIDSDVTAFDAELALVNDYAGASLVIERQGGASADDVLTFNLAGTPLFTIGAGILQANDATFATFTSSAGTLTIQFLSGATQELVNDVLQRVSYGNVGAVLPTSVDLLFTFSDGNTGNVQGSGQNPGIVVATVPIQINHLPVLEQLGGGATYVEGGLPVLVDTDVLISDVELDLLNSYQGTTLTVSRQNGVQAVDVISLGSAAVTLNGTNVQVNGTTVATLGQGPGSVLQVNFNAAATAAIADQVLQAVTYSSTDKNPGPSISLVYTFHDGATQVSGTAAVNITPVNSAPVITNLAGNILNYIENTGNVPLDQTPLSTVTDADSVDFGGGTLTVAIVSGGVITEDVLSIRAGGAITVNAGSVAHSGIAIGTVSGGTNGTPLVVSLNQAATPATVSAVMNAVSYGNLSDLPTITQRLVSLTLVDGDGIANGGVDSVSATVTVNVTPANDPPVISNLTGDVLVFTENSVAQIIDQGTAATVADPDSLDFAGGSLTITITSGGVAAQDVLSIATTATISVSGNTVSHSGTAIGTFSGGTNGAPLVVSLNAAATPAPVAALLRAIQYTNGSESPTVTQRIITVELNDGDGVLNGGIAVGTATATVQINAINDPPQLSNLNGDVLSYVEGTGVKAIDQSTAALVVDLDSLDFATGSLTVAITANGVAAQDVLSILAVGGISVSGANVSSQGTVIGTFTGGTNGNSLVVTFNSAATPTAVSALIRAIGYSNTSTTPSVSPRTVTFTVKDGDGVLNGGLDTATATATIQVTAVDTPNSTSFQNGVFPTTSYQGTDDTKIRGDNATSNYGTSATLEMDGAPDIASIVKWDISAIPANAVVQSVSITINVINNTTGTTAFNLYPMLRSWSESTATFNLASTGTPWQTAGAQGALDRGSTVLGLADAKTLGASTIQLNSNGVAVVQSWINGSAPNHGIIFQNYLDAATDDLDFSSSENTNALLRPKLTITWAAPPGTAAIRTAALKTNPNNPFDVNADSLVTPRDALIVINHLNAAEAEENTERANSFPDVSGDGVVAPLDILLIINFLNQLTIDQAAAAGSESEAEGEAFPAEFTVSADAVRESSDLLASLPLLAEMSRFGQHSADPYAVPCFESSDQTGNVDLDRLLAGLDLDSEAGASEAGHDGEDLSASAELDELAEALLCGSDWEELHAADDYESVFAAWPLRNT